MLEGNEWLLRYIGHDDRFELTIDSWRSPLWTITATLFAIFMDFDKIHHDHSLC